MTKTTKIVLMFVILNALLLYLFISLIIAPKYEQLAATTDQASVITRRLNLAEEFANMYDSDFDTGILISYSQIATELSQLSSLAEQAGLNQTSFNASAITESIDGIHEVVITTQAQGTLLQAIEYIELLSKRNVIINSINVDIEGHNLAYVSTTLYLFAYY